MAFRTIIIKNRCKLEYSLNYMICKSNDCEKKIFVNEINTIIIDTTQVVLTATLVVELMRNNVKVIFTDERHNPIGETTPYENNFYSFRKIKQQIDFSKERKDYLWKAIIKTKILNQAENLKKYNFDEEYDLLLNYYNNVEDGDSTNREGHAAKVYFNKIYGEDFTRGNNHSYNVYLDYGYTILLSAINRYIKSFGFLTEIGIHHIGESNPFNLSCDFIEPIRPLVDRIIKEKKVNDDNFKKEMVNILNMDIEYLGKTFILENALKLYVEDLLNYLQTGDTRKIRFIEYGK